MEQFEDGAHSEQATSPRRSLKVPPGHMLHVWPVPVYPARQEQLASDELPGAESVLAGQAVQNVLADVVL